MRKPISFLLFAFVAGNAAAQTWSGLGADDNWSTGANWAGGVAPASSSTTQVVFAGGPRTTPVLDAPWTINQLTVPFASGTFIFSGQALTFSGANAAVTVSSTASTARFENTVVAAGPLQVSNFGFIDFLGGIDGSGPVEIFGLGFTRLAGNSSLTAGLTVGAAQVVRLLGGASIQGPVTVQDDGILSGGGTISGAVTLSGGPSVGVLLPFEETLRTGTFTNAGFIRVTIDGPAQGTQYSHVDVTGTVTLSNPALGLGGTFVPSAGTVFTVITNDGSDPVIGTFRSLPEGATVIFNGVPLRISYVGGTGNDVTLTAFAPLAAAHRTPTLSEWALVLLALLLPAMAARRLRSRRL